MFLKAIVNGVQVNDPFTQRWQIGYRTKGIGGYTEPYYDLPEFDALKRVACLIVEQLKADFPDAEWRLVEVRP